MGKKRRQKNKAQKVSKPMPLKKSGSKGKWIGLGIVAIIALIFVFTSGSSDYPAKITPRPTIGAEDAPVLIEEFTDLQCPACRLAHPITKQLLEEFEGQVKLQYYHFPLTNIHPLAYNAHIGAECANDQGLLPEFVDIVYLNQQEMKKSDLIKYATQIGADETFKECLDSKTKDKIIQADINEGKQRNIRGTPTFFVNGKQVQTNVESLRNAIKAELSQ